MGTAALIAGRLFRRLNRSTTRKHRFDQGVHSIAYERALLPAKLGGMASCRPVLTVEQTALGLLLLPGSRWFGAGLPGRKLAEKMQWQCIGIDVAYIGAGLTARCRGSGVAIETTCLELGARVLPGWR